KLFTLHGELKSLYKNYLLETDYRICPWEERKRFGESLEKVEAEFKDLASLFSFDYLEACLEVINKYRSRNALPSVELPSKERQAVIRLCEEEGRRLFREPNP